MKAVIRTREAQEEFIYTDEITDSHIVVAVINDKPCILGKGYRQENKELSFFILSKRVVAGNGYPASLSEDTISKMADYWVRDNHPVAVFEQEDWKQALQWLIDNAK